MPIGKNSLKRVTNNGYSAVRTSAPDMENSVVAETEQKESKPTPVSKKTAPKKPSDKVSTTASKKKSTAESAPVRTAPKGSATKKTDKPATNSTVATEKTDKPAVSSVKDVATDKKAALETNGAKSYVNFGDELPVYLL